MIVSGYWSLTQYNGIKPPEFVGLQNYVDVLANPRFQRAFQNTVFFVVMGMAIGPLLGLGIGHPAQRQPPPPGALPDLVLPADDDLADRGRHDLEVHVRGQRDRQRRRLGSSGCPGHAWLTDPTTALPAVVVTAIWQGFGFETVVFLAALQAIPREYYEAATVDGAGRWAKFRWVTLPGLRPTIVFVYVIGIIGSFQTFDQVFVMTNGGPIQATRTIVFDLVDRFNRLDLGGASAVAYILLVFLAVLSYAQLRLGEERG